MTRKFRVSIGGITYNVEVEELGQSLDSAAIQAAAAPQAPSAPAIHAPGPKAAAPVASAPASVQTAPASQKVAPPAGGGEAVLAPLPGMVAAVRVEIGQQVRPGDVLLVLEAMKMENDIIAPVGGVVLEVRVAKGSGVSLGDTLVVIG